MLWYDKCFGELRVSEVRHMFICMCLSSRGWTVCHFFDEYNLTLVFLRSGLLEHWKITNVMQHGRIEHGETQVKRVSRGWRCCKCLPNSGLGRCHSLLKITRERMQHADNSSAPGSFVCLFKFCLFLSLLLFFLCLFWLTPSLWRKLKLLPFSWNKSSNTLCVSVGGIAHNSMCQKKERNMQWFVGEAMNLGLMSGIFHCVLLHFRSNKAILSFDTHVLASWKKNDQVLISPSKVETKKRESEENGDS